MNILYDPKFHGICPVCSGTKRKSVTGIKWKDMFYGYDAATDTLPCTNCGGQTQGMRATGIVKLNSEGVPCTHAYTHTTVGRCLTQYTCKHCADSYRIDSGD
jgi:hypothetical protein